MDGLDEDAKACIQAVYKADKKQGVLGKDMPRAWATPMVDIDFSGSGGNRTNVTTQNVLKNNEIYRIGDLRFYQQKQGFLFGFIKDRFRKDKAFGLVYRIGKGTIEKLETAMHPLGLAFCGELYPPVVENPKISVSDQEFQAYLNSQRALFESAGIDVDPAQFSLQPSSSVAPAVEEELSPREQYIERKIAKTLQELDQSKRDILLMRLKDNNANSVIRDLHEVAPNLKLPMQVVIGDNIDDIVSQEELEQAEELLESYEFPVDLRTKFGAEFDEIETVIKPMQERYAKKYGLPLPPALD